MSRELVARAWEYVFHHRRRDLATDLSRGRGDDWARDASEHVRHLLERELDVRARVTVVVDFDRRDSYDLDHSRRTRPPCVVGVSVEFGDLRRGGDEWSRMLRFDSIQEIAYGARECGSRLVPPRPIVDGLEISPNVLSVIRGAMDSGRDRLSQAVSKLVAICRVVADAVTLQLAASLSLRGSSYAATSTPAAVPRRASPYVMHVCLEHGLGASVLAESGVHGTVASPGDRSCLVCWQRAASRRRAVETLTAVIRVCVDAAARRLRETVDLLVEICHQVGRVLWKSVDDWTKRVCLLEPERTPYALVGGVEPDARFELLELD